MVTTTDYAGAYIYENGSLKFINHTEGYIEPDGVGGYDYVYQYKDHLGNVRLSYSDTDKDGHIADIPLFEDGFESASGWESLDFPYGSAVTAYDNTFSHSGNYSAKISTPAGDVKYVHSNTWVAIDNDQPTAYTYSGWAYSDGPGVRVHLFMNEDEETEYYTEIDLFYNYETKNEWFYFEKTVVVPSHIDKLNIRIESFYIAPGTVWFDDIKLRKTGSEIVEENNYYPFGLQHRGYNNVTNGTENRFLTFNGVELEESLGLNMYEMDLRQYDPAIARWTSLDPVIHYDYSPYQAFDNNPVFWADPSGADAACNTCGEATDIYGRARYDKWGNYIAPHERTSSDDSGIATKSDKTKTITVKSNLVLYGSEASNVDAKAIAEEIQNSYNGAKATITYNNTEYNVVFSIAVKVVSEAEAKKIASSNTDVSTNFIRIENKSTSVNRSFMELGGNAGFWVISDKLGSSTTTAHEMGHGYGLLHSNGDQRGNGIPDIMAARGTLVDPKYQWNPKASAGDYGGTINPKYRQVLQSNINMIFQNVTFQNRKANLGKVTNTIYDKNGNSQ